MDVTTTKLTKFSDQYWAGEAAMLLQRKLQRQFPDLFIYHGVTLTIPARIIIKADKPIEVPAEWQGYQVDFYERNCDGDTKEQGQVHSDY